MTIFRMLPGGAQLVIVAVAMAIAFFINLRQILFYTWRIPWVLGWGSRIGSAVWCISNFWLRSACPGNEMTRLIKAKEDVGEKAVQ